VVMDRDGGEQKTEWKRSLYSTYLNLLVSVVLREYFMQY
jgi:hypothetical protein